MTASYWRPHAAKVIQRVLKENPDKTEKELKALLRAAYPFGPRQYHPYKIWCSEVRAQLATHFKRTAKAKPVDESRLPLWLSMRPKEDA